MGWRVHPVLGIALLAVSLTPLGAQPMDPNALTEHLIRWQIEDAHDFSAWGTPAAPAWRASDTLGFVVILALVLTVCGLLWLLARARQQKKFAPLALVIRDLAIFIGGVRPLADRQVLRLSFHGRDFTKLVATIKSLVRLDLRMRVGIYNSGGREAPAWIELPRRMPPYGTDAFRRVMATLCLRREFCEGSSFETIVCAIAHEMAHVILEATGHPRRADEKMVDLTAMLCGFSEFYSVGTTRRETRSGGTVVHRFGYLSEDEVEFAARLMRKMRNGRPKM